MKLFITRTYNASKLLLKANAPTLLVAGGVTAMGVGAVLACKKTLEIEEVLEEHASKMEEIDKGLELDLDGYTEDNARRDKIRVYSRVTRDMTKLYAVPATFFLGGAGMVFGGHRIMLQRNATLAIAFTSVSKAFAEYRQRVVDTKGSEYDQGMLNGWKMKTERDPETGELHEVGVTRDWDAEVDPYNKVFSKETSKAWTNDLGVNIMTISNQQRFANILLNQRNYLYLSEVYQSLGMEETDISRVVGWKVKRLPDGSRDIPFVDFGINKPHPDDWKHNYANEVYLDFNCQGLIIGGRVQKALEKA